MSADPARSRPIPGARPERRDAVLGSSLRLFSVGGVDVRVHVSWVVIAGLVTWSLATGYFPAVVPAGNATEDWVLGAIAALLFFASVLAHELAHSLVARARGLDVDSITLFIFGGVSNLAAEPKRPGMEFAIAIVGPLTSFVIAAAAYLVAAGIPGTNAVTATASYVAFINAALGVFNLVPGFPLDGGRVLRSIVWSVTRDVRRATEVATAVGQLVAWGLMLWGFWRIVGGDVIGGVWTTAIGWFLQNAASATLQQTVLESRLRRIRVGDVLRPDASGAPPGVRVDELIERYVLPGARRAVPIIDNGRLVGLVTLSDLARVPAQERPSTTAAEIMTPADRLTTVTSDAPVQVALTALGTGDYEQVPVVDGTTFVGLLTRAAVLREIQIRETLGLDRQAPAAHATVPSSAPR